MWQLHKVMTSFNGKYITQEKTLSYFAVKLSQKGRIANFKNSPIGFHCCKTWDIRNFEFGTKRFLWILPKLSYFIFTHLRTPLSKVQRLLYGMYVRNRYNQKLDIYLDCSTKIGTINVISLNWKQCLSNLLHISFEYSIFPGEVYGYLPPPDWQEKNEDKSAFSWTSLETVNDIQVVECK